MKTNKNKGFTLVELLIVIAIIGILSAVIIAALGSARQKSKDNAAIAQMNQARNQAEIYFNTVGSYENLCNHSGTSDTDFGMKQLIFKAAEAIGINTADPNSFYQIYVRQTGNNGTPNINGIYVRCHNTAGNYFYNPRWAAQVPMSKLASGKRIQYYCMDSTGAGFITTKDLATCDTTEYLGCILED